MIVLKHILPKTFDLKNVFHYNIFIGGEIMIKDDILNTLSEITKPDVTIITNKDTFQF